AVVSLDAAFEARYREVRGGGFAEFGVAGGSAVGAGLVVGASGALELEGGEVAGRIGFTLSASAFVPGWFGPLYEIERRGIGDPAAARPLADAVADDDLGGIGGLAELAATAPGLGHLVIGYLGRPGLGDVFSARAALPSFHQVQVGANAAAATDGDRIDAAVLAAEVRV